MADSYTPNFAFTKCEVGSSRDSWGAKLNTNFDVIDQYLGWAAPIGIVLDFAGPSAPSGWLICDGRLISRVTYAALFAVIGTWWSAGDGTTTFGLPPTPGRTTCGPGTVIDENGTSVAFPFTSKLGAVNRSLLQANLPALTLTSSTIAAHSHGGVTALGANHSHTMDSQGLHSHNVSGAPDHAHTGYTDNQGVHSHQVSSRAASGGGGTTGAFPIYSQGFTFQGASTDNSPAHAHNVQTYNAGAHGHTLDNQGAHAHNIAASGNLQLGINPDNAHSHTIALGGVGAGVSILQPLLVMTKIIYAGHV